MPYSKLSDVPPQLREYQGATLTLEQANYVARIADRLEREGQVENPYAVAWAQFERAYVKKGARWVKRKRRGDEAVPGPMPMRGRARAIDAGPAGSLAPLGEGDHYIEIARPGWTVDGKRYYTETALRQAAEAGLYDGAKMYVNHGDPLVDARRGHRDLRDWQATIRPGSVRYTGSVLMGMAHVHDPDSLIAHILDDPVARQQTGISQDVTFRYYERTVDGKPAQVVEAIEEVHSVDWVPKGNAWGRVAEAYHRDHPDEADVTQDAQGADEDEQLSVAQEASSMMAVRDVTLDQLEVERPDLVEAIIRRVREAEQTLDEQQWAVYRAVEQRWGADEDAAQVVEVHADFVVVRRDDGFERYDYTVGEDGAVVLADEGVPVEKRWEPVGGGAEPDTPDEEATEPGDAGAEEPEQEQQPEEQAQQEAMREAVQQVHALAERVALLEAENAALREEQARTRMLETVREQVRQAEGLSAPSRERIIAAWAASEVLEGDALRARIAEAIEAERQHEQALARALGARSRVRVGPTAAAETTRSSEGAEARAAFVARAIAHGIDPATAERLAAAR